MKGLLTGEFALQFFIQTSEPDLQHAVELLLFGFHNFRHAVGGVLQFGISALHEIADCVDHIEEKWLLLPQQSAVPNPAPQDFAQHIAAPLI